MASGLSWSRMPARSRWYSAQLAMMSLAKSSMNRIAQISKSGMTAGWIGAVLFSLLPSAGGRKSCIPVDSQGGIGMRSAGGRCGAAPQSLLTA